MLKDCKSSLPLFDDHPLYPTHSLLHHSPTFTIHHPRIWRMCLRVWHINAGVIIDEMVLIVEICQTLRNWRRCGCNFPARFIGDLLVQMRHSLCNPFHN